MRRFEYQPHAESPSGAPIESSQLLVRLGPLIQVVVGVPPVLHQSLVTSGKPVPASQSVVGLIDSGCTRTAVDNKIVSGLGISPTGAAPVGTAGGQTRASLVPVQLIFPGLEGVTITLPQALTCDLTGQPVSVLIGRDILRHFVMIYDGMVGRVTLLH